MIQRSPAQGSGPAHGTTAGRVDPSGGREAAPPKPETKQQALRELALSIASMRLQGKQIVHCHGVFDLLHVGHIRHLEKAKAMGDVLVVTITPDEHVNKGPDRPAFPAELRAEHLAALDCVDAVAVNEWPEAVETIRLLRPDVYVKGSEYAQAEDDISGNINTEREAIESVGGRLAFTEDITFSSSNLINRYLPTMTDQAQAFLGDLRQRYSIEDIRRHVESLRDLKVLVLGETIIDEYQYCEAIGKSCKEPTLVVKAGQCEQYAGGILAVANHVADFAGRTTVLTQLGTYNSHEESIRRQLHGDLETRFLHRQNSPTIVKRRFVDSYFFTKLLEIYEINDADLAPEDETQLLDALSDALPQYDLVILVDFGHSMMTPRAVDLVCRNANFLALNTQANAGNFGFNTISKYLRADLLCVAENEMRLEARNRRGEMREIMQSVAQRLDCAYATVTRGKNGCLCYEKDHDFTELPALASKVVDRVGAGDTFLALMAPLLAAKAPTQLAAFVASIAAAQAVATVGHSRYVQRIPLLKHIEVMLK